MIERVGQDIDIAAPDAMKVQEWATALAAAGIPFEIAYQDELWFLRVWRDDEKKARREIAAFEEANRDWPPVQRPEPVDSEGYRTWAGFWGAHILLLFSIWIGPYDSAHALCRAGATDGVRIAAGEWWRAMTAMTLHSGVVHLAGNLVFLLIFAQAVCGRLGPGLGWLLILLSGFAGNLTNALVFRSEIPGIGASTAGFGALGLLTVAQAADNHRRYGEWRSVWSRTWIPLGAGLALLGLTGSGEQTDLISHAMGFAWGGILSIPAGEMGRRWVTPPGQWALAGAGILCITAAWVFAWLMGG